MICKGETCPFAYRPTQMCLLAKRSLSEVQQEPCKDEQFSLAVRSNGNSLGLNHTCSGCPYAESIPGDCHINCVVPRDRPQPLGRPRVWPGCGFYPLAFDQNIVLYCEGGKVLATPEVTE